MKATDKQINKFNFKNLFLHYKPNFVSLNETHRPQGNGLSEHKYYTIDTCYKFVIVLNPSSIIFMHFESSFSEGSALFDRFTLIT